MGAVILMVPLSTPLIRKASVMVRTRLNIFSTLLYLRIASSGPLTNTKKSVREKERERERERERKNDTYG